MKNLFTKISPQTIVSLLKKLAGPAIIMFFVLCIAGAVWFSQPWVIISETLPTNPSAKLQKIETQISTSSNQDNDRQITVTTNQLIGYTDSPFAGQALYAWRYVATYRVEGTQFIVDHSSSFPILISLNGEYISVQQPSDSDAAEKGLFDKFPRKIQIYTTNTEHHNELFAKAQKESAKIATDYFKTIHITPR